MGFVGPPRGGPLRGTIGRQIGIVLCRLKYMASCTEWRREGHGDRVFDRGRGPGALLRGAGRRGAGEHAARAGLDGARSGGAGESRCDVSRRGELIAGRCGGRPSLRFAGSAAGHTGGGRGARGGDTGALDDEPVLREVPRADRGDHGVEWQDDDDGAGGRDVHGRRTRARDGRQHRRRFDGAAGGH